MSVATAIENLSARIQDAYIALSAKGATMPAEKTTANLSSTINSIPEPVMQDKETVVLNRNTDTTTMATLFEKDIYPDEGYDGISHVKFRARGLNLTINPTTSQQVKEAPIANGAIGYKTVTINPVTSSIDSNIQAENIKNGVTILGVTGNLVTGITPAGNIQLTSTAQTDVTNYATALVVDADLVAGNIKKDVNILGITGTYEGSGGGGSLQGYTLTLTNNDEYSNECEVDCYKTDGTIVRLHVNGMCSDVVYAKLYGSYNSDDAARIGNTWIKFSGYYHNNYTNYIIIHLLADLTIYTENWGCILKGSLVNLWNGITKKIEDITYEDELLCWDFDNGKYAPAKPFWIKKALKNTFYWINKFESGKEIKTTGTIAGHRFFNIDKGKFLYNTECVGDLCYTKDGPDRLLEAKYVEGECEFYNIYTNYHMNLFANGILTGFRYNNLYPIKDMKFVKDGRVQRSKEEFKSIPDSWFYGMRCSELTDSVENITSYALKREMIKK